MIEPIVNKLLNQRRVLEEEHVRYLDLARQVATYKNPVYDDAASIFHVLSASEVVVLGIGRQARIQKVAFNGNIAWKGDAFYAEDSDGRDHQLSWMGILPSDKKGWNRQFVSVPNTEESLSPAIGWLLEVGTDTSVKTAELLVSYVGGEFPSQELLTGWVIP